MKYCSNCSALLVRKVPDDDNRERWVCDRCNTVHYQNPLPVVGCVAERDGRVLLCKRSIEPRYGFWTVPAGFMELGESLAGGAASGASTTLLAAQKAPSATLRCHSACMVAS